MMMGRVAAVLAALLVFACPALAGDDAINPAKWSKNQWRSDLFDTYPTYPRYHRLRVVKHETRVHTIVMQTVSETAIEAKPVTPTRPRLIRIGSSESGDVRVRTVAGEARGCQGMLVITWTGDRAVSKCRRAIASGAPVEAP
jgi:hypothetical protein